MAKAYDIVNEQVVIAAILKDDACRRRALSCLKPRDFQGKKHRVIFASVNRCEATDVKPTKNNIAVHAEGDDFGGIRYLDKIISLDVADSLDHNLDLLRRDSARVQARKSAEELQEIASDKSLDYSEVVRGADEISAALRDAPLRSVGNQVLEDWEADFDRRRDGKVQFVTTGFDSMDSVDTEGHAKGSLSVVAGRPRMGKSMLMVEKTKRLMKKPVEVRPRVCVVPQEKGSNYFLNMLVSNMSRVSLTTIIKYADKLSGEQLRKINKVRKRLHRLRDEGYLTILDRPFRSLVRAGKLTNEAALDRMGEILSEGLYDITIWDLWSRALRDLSANGVARTLFGFYDFGVDTGTHNILVHQLGRQVEDRSKDKARRPTINDLKQSGAYEEVADRIELVHRESVMKKFMRRRDMMEVELAKQKQGADGDVMLATFRPEICSVTKDRIASPEDVYQGPSFMGRED